MIVAKRIGFIPLNALLMLVVVLYFYPMNVEAENFISDVCFAATLTLIGTVIYLCTTKMMSSLLFLLLMYLSAWVMILINAPSHLYVGIGRVLMSVAPNLLFIFFVYFTELPRKQPYHRWNFWLLNSSVATLVALLSFQPLLGYMFFFHILFGVLACFRISAHYRSRQRRVLNRERLLLNVAVAASFGPFIFGSLLFSSVLPPQARYFSIYMMIALPIAVGYILMRRSGLQARYNYLFILRLAAIALAGVSLFLGFAYYVIELTLLNALLLLFVALVIFYLYWTVQQAISKRQLQTVSRAKEDMEKERLDILQKVTYDHYLTSLGGLIEQLIDKTLSLDGTMIVWREENRNYILQQNGIFENFSLDQSTQEQLREHSNNVTVGGESYFVFPLVYRKTLNGWMIVGHKSSGAKFTVEEVETLSLLADTICEIFTTTEILQENQRRYVYLPSLRYEDYQNVYVTRSTEKIRKEMALYLHDDILQSILAVRNMCEAVGGVDPEIRALIVDTLDELNTSIREKMFDVYPTTLQDLGLYQSLSILCRKLQEEAVGQPGLKIRLDAEIGLEVEEELEYTVFRTVKELLQNAVKHAEASEIIVSLEASEEGVLLGDVIDDGKGFDIERQLSAPAEGNHLGLLSVKQEMNALGGELTIRHNAEAGMHIHFKIPLGRMGR